MCPLCRFLSLAAVIRSDDEVEGEVEGEVCSVTLPNFSTLDNRFTAEEEVEAGTEYRVFCASEYVLYWYYVNLRLKGKLYDKHIFCIPSNIPVAHHYRATTSWSPLSRILPKSWSDNCVILAWINYDDNFHEILSKSSKTGVELALLVRTYNSLSCYAIFQIYFKVLLLFYSNTSFPSK